MSDYGAFEKHTLPSGITVFYRDSDHSYHLEIQEKGGKWTAVQASRLVGVTTLLNCLAKDGLLDWAANLAKEGIDWKANRNKAGERGTNTHDLVLRTLQKERTSLSDLPDDHRPYGQAAFKWLSEKRPEVIQAETVVVHDEQRYAGRFDILAKLDGFKVRVDLKTVTKWSADKKGRRYPPYPENCLQLDLYEGAALRSGYESADHGLVVRLGPDGTYDETPVALDPDRGLAVLGAYRARAQALSALKSGLPVAA